MLNHIFCKIFIYYPDITLGYIKNIIKESETLNKSRILLGA